MILTAEEASVILVLLVGTPAIVIDVVFPPLLQLTVRKCPARKITNCLTGKEERSMEEYEAVKILMWV